jgi:hypothetical protein
MNELEQLRGIATALLDADDCGLLDYARGIDREAQALSEAIENARVLLKRARRDPPDIL